MTRALLHLLCFAFPLYTLAFTWSGPHEGVGVLVAVLPVIAAILLDAAASPERSPPATDAPAAWFDAVLVALAALQGLNVIGLARLAARGAGALDLAVAVFLVGAGTGYSAIVVAHELVHRKPNAQRQLGRLLLTTALYEHFATEHVRGHHKRVGTAEDPATARRGERLWPFLLRTVPGQLASAWRLECQRLGDPAMAWWDRRQLGNRVLHGKIVEWGLAAAIGVVGGPVAFAVHLGQAAWAVLLLETVNYVEHWGLERRGTRVQTTDSWDSESWFTYYTLVGLSRHADHHAHASRPWQDLRAFPESPKMPWGYWATVIGSLVANGRVMARMEATLSARSGGERGDLAPLA